MSNIKLGTNSTGFKVGSSSVSKIYLGSTSVWESGPSFTATAVLLTTGTSYAVPAGATNMKVWAVGGGGGSNNSFGAGGAGGCSYKTFAVSTGSVAYSIGSAGGALSNGGNTTVTYTSLTISGNGGQSDTGTYPYTGVGGTFSGGDGGSNGGPGQIIYENNHGGAVGGNSASLLSSCDRRPASDVNGLFAALILAGSSATATCASRTVAAFGAGGGVGKYISSYDAGLGGGRVGYNSRIGLAGAGAVVLYFT